MHPRTRPSRSHLLCAGLPSAARATLLALLALVALPGTAAAQEGALTRLETNSGKTYQGTILGDDGSQLEFRTTDGMTLKLPHDSLTLMTRYRLRRDATPDDADAQFELARWCVDQTLYEEARRHYKAALAKDPSLEERVKAQVDAARAQAGAELLARAKALQADGRDAEARAVLGTIVKELPQRHEAQEAAKLLAEDAHERKQSALSPAPSTGDTAADGSRAKRPDGSDFSDATRTLFARVIEHYHDMLDHTRDGLLESSQSRSIDLYEKALKDGERAGKEADKLRPHQAQSPEQQQEVLDALVIVDQNLQSAEVEARLHLADAYMMRKSYNDAARVIDTGLAAYPDDQELRAAKQRVTAAASDGLFGDGDIVIVGRGGLGRRR